MVKSEVGVEFFTGSGMKISGRSSLEADIIVLGTAGDGHVKDPHVRCWQSGASGVQGQLPALELSGV